MKNKPKSQSEIKSMRQAGTILADTILAVKSQTKPGMSSWDLARLAEQELKNRGGEPVFRGYQGYPDIICIAINEDVQHTIPSKSTIINNGDIINLDFGVQINGMITDAAITYGVGEISPSAQNLLTGTEEALMAAINILKPGVRISEVSKIIESTLKYYGLGIVRELCGHGVGHQLHEDPEIPNFLSGSNNFKLKSGMTIAIEPIATAGSPAIKFLPNGWDIKTKDGSWAAQFEHTILITDTGHEILTLPS